MQTFLTFKNLFRAYLDCKKCKTNTLNHLRFAENLEENLLKLEEKLQTRTYKPGRSIAFVVQKPKIREIFAADFRDRVVHHLLYNYLSPIFERQFIYDSWACRKGKGTHRAMLRLRKFMSQISSQCHSERSEESSSDILRTGLADASRSETSSVILRFTQDDRFRMTNRARERETRRTRLAAVIAMSDSDAVIWPTLTGHHKQVNTSGRVLFLAAGIAALSTVARNDKREAYYLQMDIKSFFTSINQQILYDLIAKKVKN